MADLPKIRVEWGESLRALKTINDSKDQIILEVKSINRGLQVLGGSLLNIDRLLTADGDGDPGHADGDAGHDDTRE